MLNAKLLSKPLFQYQNEKHYIMLTNKNIVQFREFFVCQICYKTLYKSRTYRSP